MRREKGEGVELAAGCRWAAGIGALVVAASLAGCGGGVSEKEPAGGGAQSGGSGTLKVKVTDVAGDPVAGAIVSWYGNTKTITVRTGADGTVQVDDVPSGRAEVCASHLVRGSSCGPSGYVTLQAGQVLEVVRQLELNDAFAVAVLGATVPPGGVGADGRSLDVTVRVAMTQGSEGESRLSNMWVPQCEARIGAELGELGPRCISGPEGDNSYAFDGVTEASVITVLNDGPKSTAVGLLIDQSEAGLSSDWNPNEPRLFAAKVLTDSLLPDASLALAAFANAALLPSQPVTFFPVDEPGFIGSRQSAFGVLQDLSGLVGGEAPLYEAIVTAIDFLVDRAPPGSEPALLVLADGRDDSSCSGFDPSPSKCAARRLDVVKRVTETGVRLFLVASDTDEECIGYFEREYCQALVNAKEPLSELSRAGGIPLSVGPVQDLTSPLGLARQWLSGTNRVQDVSFRLISDVPGAFAPGAVVTGALRVSDVTILVDGGYELPFRVQVPDPAP